MLILFKVSLIFLISSWREPHTFFCIITCNGALWQYAVAAFTQVKDLKMSKMISGVSSSSRLSKASEMDHHWVATSWLSDVGLPQYSQTFQTHLVDGRVLNSLSRRDLERFLNISDQYHQTSLLLAIQLLQILCFDKEVRFSIEINTRRSWNQCIKFCLTAQNCMWCPPCCWFISAGPHLSLSSPCAS